MSELSAFSGDTYTTRTSSGSGESADSRTRSSSAVRNAASVFPDPVGAATSVWRPARIDSQPRCCAAVGVPDEKSGEAVKLVIVKGNPAITEADVRAYCEQNLTGYKRPKIVEFRTDLPKTPVGKILRRELRNK